MKLGDVYVNKKDKSIIQIDSYATHMGNFPEKSIIVFRQMERHYGCEIGSVPSFNGYGSREEIESEYELLVPHEKLKNYSDWNEIFDMVEKSRWIPVFRIRILQTTQILHMEEWLWQRQKIFIRQFIQEN